MSNIDQWAPKMVTADNDGRAVTTAVLSLEGVLIGEGEKDLKTGEYTPGITCGMLRHALENINFDALELRVTSMGGSLVDALDMVDALKECNKPITFKGYGYVCSAATLLAMCATKSYLAPSCTFMVHPPVGGIVGTPEEIDQYNAHFRALRDRAYGLYAAKTGKSVEEIAHTHRDAVWYQAKDAVTYGFVDALTSDDHSSAPETPEMAVPKPGMYNVWKLGAMAGVDFCRKKVDAADAENLKKQIETLNATITGLRCQLEQHHADYATQRTAFDAAVSEQLTRHLAAMGADPDQLPSPSSVENKRVPLSGGLEDMLRTSTMA